MKDGAIRTARHGMEVRMRCKTLAARVHSGDITREDACENNPKFEGYAQRREALTPAQLKTLGVRKADVLLVTGAQLGELKASKPTPAPAKSGSRKPATTGAVQPSATTSVVTMTAAKFAKLSGARIKELTDAGVTVEVK